MANPGEPNKANVAPQSVPMRSAIASWVSRWISDTIHVDRLS